MKIVFLGTGTSFGIPELACACKVCRSRDRRDTRFRSSVYVEGNDGERILIDAGPEFRLQALRAGITGLDAVLFTHVHADHAHGIDDVRPFTRKRSLCVYASEPDAAEFRERFSYVFSETQLGGGKPKLDLRVIPADGIAVGGSKVVPIPLFHGERPVLGYRIGDFAYLTDCSAIPESSVGLLSGLRLLAIDGLRLRPHPTHFSVDQALDFAARVSPERALLTHICHESSHRSLAAYCAARKLPFPVGPAFDGLSVKL